MSRALILIDIQNDYFKGGAAELEGTEAAAHNASLLLKHFREIKLPVIHVQHHSVRKNATFFIPGTRGAEISETVSPAENEKVIIKNFPNSFRNTELLQALASLQIKEPVFCGMMTHMCVHSTVLAAFDLGFSNTVAWDACATRSLGFKGRQVTAADHAGDLALKLYPMLQESQGCRRRRVYPSLSADFLYSEGETPITFLNALPK